MKRTTLAKHAATEIASAGPQRLSATLSALVSYGEMTYSGRLPLAGPSVMEIAALVAELREAGWAPTSSHHYVMS